ncbi:hypothetical protein HDR59_02970 [bacterium]|nr:hypothetical protein [bacterium]
MKKYLINFVLLCVCFFQVNNARADLWDMWIDEDEEANMKGVSGGDTMTTTRTTTTRTQNVVGQPSTMRTTLRETVNIYNTQQPEQVYNSQQYIQPQNVVVQPVANNTVPNKVVYTNTPVNNNYAFIDYDTIQEERNIPDSEIVNSIDKWQLGLKNIYWENYRGNNIRIEVLRNNRDIKEMRLKFVQSQDIISDPDGSISDILNKVAEQVMKRTCGKKSKQSIILYERPSIELVKETTYDNYKVVAKGNSLKEYGFRCIY